MYFFYSYYLQGVKPTECKRIQAWIRFQSVGVILSQQCEKNHSTELKFYLFGLSVFVFFSWRYEIQ